MLSLSASEAKKAIEMRIAPVGSICLEGQDCGSAAPASSQAMAPVNDLPQRKRHHLSQH